MTTINRAPWSALVDDSGQNLDGSLWNKAAIQTVLLDPIDASLATLDSKDATQDAKLATISVGAWTNVPYLASNFTASAGMTWTVTAGNVAFNRYTLIGKTLIWLVYIEASTLAGTAGPQLFIKFPAGLVGSYKRGVVTTTQLFDGTSNRGWARVGTDNVSLIVEKDPSANYALNSGTTYVEFTIILEVN